MTAGKLLASLALAMAVGLNAAPAAAQQVTLRFAHFLPAVSNFHQKVLLPWCAAIDKDSGGRLKCQAYPSMQLGGTPAQLVDQVRNGVADIVFTAAGYSPGRFPITETVEMPFTVPAGGLDGARFMWEYYQGFAQKEYDDYKMLAIFSGGGMVIHTVGKPVTTLAGFKGLKLRTPTRLQARLITALGGVPVSVAPAQITEAISKGVIDGALAPWELVPATKLDEVTRNHTELGARKPAFTGPSVMVLMNKQKYASLPADLKAVIDRNSGLAMTEMAGRAWDVAIDAARAKAIASGHTVAVVPDAELAAMIKATQPIEQEWATELRAKGIDGEALIKSARAISARILSAK